VGPQSVKVIVAGGFGTGKTTLVGAVSEISPLTTEEVLTQIGEGVDDTAGIESKTTTTVALDFGRRTIADDLVLYLFGTPGQDRFWFMWDELSRGATGAMILVDPRRLDTSFPAIDYFEARDLPFVVAVNLFHGRRRHTLAEVREALQLEDSSVTLIEFDARDAASCRSALVTLVEHAMARLPAVTVG
jgi:signal recognition particle receptor subunit beta